MSKGYIYIMTNPCLHDMVKIGYSADVEKRRKQLSTTALPYDYEVYAIYETSGNLEDRKLHQLIDNLNPDLRVSRDREFFIMSPEDAYSLLEAIAIISGSQNRLHRIKPAEGSSPSSDDASETQIKRRPAVNFSKCHIPLGAQLIYQDDPSIVVTVVSDHKVQYRDEITSLSAIAKSIKGYSVAGPMCFSYQGKLISEIAEETQWKDSAR